MRVFTIAILICAILISCESQEIIRENQIPEIILIHNKYIGRLPEDPDRREKGLFYYNTKKLNFRICKRETVWAGKSVVLVDNWKYIKFAKLIEKIEKEK